MSARYGRERVKRGLAHFLIGKGVSAIAGVLAMVFIVRGLSFADFANYSVLIAFVEVFTAFSGLGLAHLVLRYVPELYAAHRSVALRNLVAVASSLRSVVLVVALGATYLAAGSVAGWLGRGEAVSALRAFLWVVFFRSSSQYFSQVLESTLNQGVSQAAFSLSSFGRCAGVLWLHSRGGLLLADLIVVEAVCDALACAVMLYGMFRVLQVPSLSNSGEDEEKAAGVGWVNANGRQLARFACAAYLQHLATIPFGGNTNRLVGGTLFGDHLMASFGFALSLYDYVKRYLPTQFLVGLIRPVLVARYSANSCFSSAAQLCEQAVQVNLLIVLGGILVLMVAGPEAMQFISGGKYGAKSAWLLLVLLVMVVLETQRLVLELLAQMIERYDILILSNVFLSLSVFLGVAAYPWLGAIAFPLANLMALVLANEWVRFRISRLAGRYQQDWHSTGIAVVLLGVGVAVGWTVRCFGGSWYAGVVIGVGFYGGILLAVRGRYCLNFAQTFIGSSVIQKFAS